MPPLSIETHDRRRTVHPVAQAQMQAARLIGPRQIEIAVVPIPVPGPGQVLIRLEGCGLSSSSLALWQGRSWFHYPLAVGAPGHEGWGRVNAVGPGVKHWQIGKRVAFLGEHSFAEFALAEARALVPIPTEIALFPGESLGCAVNIFRRANIHANQTVAVVGSGFIGALLVQLATRQGARVLALSRRPYSREIARRAGARCAFGVDGAARERVLELTGGAGCERVIEAAGTQESLTLASQLVKTRGRLIIAGYHQDGPREINMQLWNSRGIDVINAHERNPNAYTSGMSAAVDLIARMGLKTDYLYTHSFSLERFADAFNTLEARPYGFVKGWIGF